MKPGAVIAGKYRIDHVLGQGGMGIVFAATHLGLRERVAIKVLTPDLAGHDVIVARFLREARAAAAIKGDHVARVIDVDAWNGAPYIVMEYLDGLSLAEVLARERPSVTSAVDWILQACEALAEAHRVGVIHRDLKPANLFLARRPDGSSTLKVLDFGISKFDPVEHGEATLTDTKHPLGTPLYMSPEQLASASRVDGRTDIWSLGVVLFECVTGRRPFASLIDTLNATPVTDELPPTLSRVVLCCLAKQKEERFANIAALAQALRPLASAEGIRSIDHIERLTTTRGGGDADVDSALAFAVAETDPATTRPIAMRDPVADTLGATSSSHSAASDAARARARRALLVVIAVLLLAVPIAAVLMSRQAPTLQAPASTPSLSISEPAPPVMLSAPIASSTSVVVPSTATPSKKKAIVPAHPKPRPTTTTTAKTKSNEDI